MFTSIKSFEEKHRFWATSTKDTNRSLFVGAKSLTLPFIHTVFDLYLQYSFIWNIKRLLCSQILISVLNYILLTNENLFLCLCKKSRSNQIQILRSIILYSRYHLYVQNLDNIINQAYIIQSWNGSANLHQTSEFFAMKKVLIKNWCERNYL